MNNSHANNNIKSTENLINNHRTHSVLDLLLWIYLTKCSKRHCSSRLNYKTSERDTIALQPSLGRHNGQLLDKKVSHMQRFKNTSNSNITTCLRAELQLMLAHLVSRCSACLQVSIHSVFIVHEVLTESRIIGRGLLL